VAGLRARDNHIAPVVLFTEPLLTELLTPAYGRALLQVPRGSRRIV
jgi:hypothetical protein